MRRAASIFVLLGALTALAVDPALLMRTHTDPSRMFMVQNVRSVDVMTGFLGGGEEGFTAVAWIRFYPTNAVYVNAAHTLWSVKPARATREGGALLPAIMEYQTVTDNSTLRDPLAMRAIFTYAAMRFGNPPNYDKLQAAYETQKVQLMHAKDYTDYGEDEAGDC